MGGVEWPIRLAMLFLDMLKILKGISLFPWEWHCGVKALMANTRFANEDEKISRISKTEDQPFIDLVIRKITAWLKDGTLP